MQFYVRTQVNQVSYKISGASLPRSQWGDCTQMWSKVAATDHERLA